MLSEVGYRPIWPANGAVGLGSFPMFWHFTLFGAKGEHWAAHFFEMTEFRHDGLLKIASRGSRDAPSCGPPAKIVAFANAFGGTAQGPVPTAIENQRAEKLPRD